MNMIIWAPYLGAHICNWMDSIKEMAFGGPVKTACLPSNTVKGEILRWEHGFKIPMLYS